MQGLVGTVAVSGGCLGLGGSPGSSDGRVSVSGGDVPERANVDVSAAVLTEPTDESPAKIRLELTNTAAETRTFLFGEPAPFQGGVSRGDTVKLLLLDDEEAGINPLEENHYIPEERPGECWTAMASRPSFNALGNPRNLLPGETIANDYVLLSTGRSECPVTGTFQFTFDIPAADVQVRETDDGLVEDIRYPTWDLSVTFDPVPDGTKTSP